MTTGDIGLPVSRLKEAFPEVLQFRRIAASHMWQVRLTLPHCHLQMQNELDALPERWWYSPKDNDAVKHSFRKHEPKKSLKAGPLIYHILHHPHVCYCLNIFHAACRSEWPTSANGFKTSRRRSLWRLGTAACCTSLWAPRSTSGCAIVRLTPCPYDAAILTSVVDSPIAGRAVATLPILQ